MNAIPWRREAGRWLVLLFAFLTCGLKVFAQSSGSNLIPVVTIEATQPLATATNPGVFTIFRAGNTNGALNVYCQIGGAASNGVDYALIPNLVNIPAGTTSSTVLITPLTHPPSSSAARTVILTLTNPPTLNPVNYGIGSPSSATVYIAGSGVTNLPPEVGIISPPGGAVFYTPTNIIILAKAGDPDGSVTNVEFFAGTNDLGPGVMVVLDPPGVNGITGPVYLFNWLNPSPGDYPLTAVATDNDGMSTTSAPVNITVLQGPPTNLPPVVRIVSPANGSVFRAPINLPLYAFANDPGGYITAVQFFAGTNSLGFGERLPVVEPLASGNVIVVGGPPPPIYPTNLFLLIWTNAPVGTDFLTAVATDNGGLSTTSAPAKIIILPPLPPTTNRPPIVSIVASDPVAIEGTNCWVWPGETNSPPTWATWPTAVCRPFTNCAPKTATFTVRRFGDTNADLTVTYAIGGTASNGVDYVALPDFVTIPAGERRGFITIVPIDDGPPDVNKTVILTLTPSTNTPPDYLPGFPRCAAAIILDPKPCATSGMLPGGCFHFTAPGPDAAWFYVQCSTDLVDWTTICTNQVINGSIDFVDPNAANNQSLFYRAVPLATPPSE